jgi:hypothetical protein
MGWEVCLQGPSLSCGLFEKNKFFQDARKTKINVGIKLVADAWSEEWDMGQPLQMTK